MNKILKTISITALAVCALSAIPLAANAEADSSIAELEKAVAVCQHKVQQLEIRCITSPAFLKRSANDGYAKNTRGRKYDGFERETGFGGAYWGYQRDN